MTDTKGIAVTPGRGLHLSEDVRLNYLLSAVRQQDRSPLSE